MCESDKQDPSSGSGLVFEPGPGSHCHSLETRSITSAHHKAPSLSRIHPWILATFGQVVCPRTSLPTAIAS